MATTPAPETSAAPEASAEPEASAAPVVASVVDDEMLARYPTAEEFLAVPVETLVRFGKWDSILGEPAPPPARVYETGMWHYARGIAYTRTGDVEKAAAELATRIDDAAPRFADATAIGDEIEIDGDRLVGPRIEDVDHLRRSAAYTLGQCAVDVLALCDIDVGLALCLVGEPGVLFRSRCRHRRPCR